MAHFKQFAFIYLGVGAVLGFGTMLLTGGMKEGNTTLTGIVLGVYILLAIGYGAFNYYRQR